MQLTLKLLGGLQVAWADAPQATIATGKSAALVCYLAVTGRPHARASLASLLWGEMSDSEARNNLRVTLSSLRRDCAEHLIVTREMLAFNTDAPYVLDVQEFLAALQHAHATTPPDVDALRTAVGLYQGDFLDGFSVHDAPEFDEWLSGQRERLRQMAVQAQHDLAGQATQQQDYSAAAEPPTPAPPRNRLPIYPTAMVGRATQLAQVTALLEQPSCRLVTMYGPGGIGKTRLALAVASEVAASFADGAVFVPLGAISDPELVAGAIAQMLEVRETNGRPLRDQLVEYLHEKQMLLVLDNFEQVTAAAPLVADLLAACAHLRLIVTSREVLRLRGEHEVVVPPLTVPAGDTWSPSDGEAPYGAVALFVDRARAVQPRFQLTADNAATIVAICARLDGLPLAIELAAARSRMLSPQALLSRLGSRLTLWASGTRDTPERQRTLRDTIRWSYELLEPDEQTLFARLGAFVGGFTLATAEAVCEQASGPQFFVLDLLESLVGKSLIWQQDGLDGEPRFGMLEMIREYALERLEASGEAAAIQRQHALVLLDLAETAEPELGGRAQVLWLDRLEAEHDNLRAALRWALDDGADELALRLGGALMHFWYMHGHYGEGRRWLQAALQRQCPQTPLAVRAKALNSAGFLAYYQSDIDEAHALLTEALDLARQAGDTQQIATALQNLATVLHYQDDYARATDMHEESVRLFRSIGNTAGVALGLYRLGNSAESSNIAAASALYQESLALFRTVGDTGGIAAALMSLGLLHQQQTEYDRAMPYFTEALALNRALRNPLGTAWAVNHMGYVALHQGDYQRAAGLFTEGQTLSRRLGNKAGIASGHLWLGHVARKQGDSATAEQSFLTAVTLFLPLDPKYVVASLDGLALVAADQVVVHSGSPPQHGLASTASAERAARLWGVADAMRETINAPLPVDERAETEPLVAIVRTALGEQTFDEAWRQGRAMTPEQIIRDAGVAPVAVTRAA